MVSFNIEQKATENNGTAESYFVRYNIYKSIDKPDIVLTINLEQRFV